MTVCILLPGRISFSRLFCLRLGSAMAASGSAFDAKSFQWVAQLPQAWESKRALRERSLEGRCLLRGLIQPGHGDREVVLGNIECCKLNSEVLLILLKSMADAACIFVPKVFLLQGAMLEFHCHAGYPDAISLGVAAYSDGWGLKRMLTFVKRKWMRGQNARESRLYQVRLLREVFSFGAFCSVLSLFVACLCLRTGPFGGWWLSSSELTKI